MGLEASVQGRIGNRKVRDEMDPKDNIRDVFVGQYDAKVSENGRVKIPADWATAFPPGETAYVAKSIDSRSLCLLTTRAMEGLLSDIRDRALFDVKVKLALDEFGTKTEWITVNDDGTITLSEEMRKYANIKTSVSFIGTFTTIRIWSSSALAC